MSRSTSPLVLFGTLSLGVAVGVIAGRTVPDVAAQSNRPPRAGSAAPVLAAGREAQVKSSGTEEELYRQLGRQYEEFAHVNRTFELVARAVSPAVVHIVATKTSRSEDSPHVRRYEETGSGVIVRGDRGRELYVLTNNHVIEGAKAEKVNIALHDGRSLHPRQMWLDAKADIAVLSLGRDDLPAARFGDSDNVSVGSWVLALGSPFGLTHSVSQGIISARGRHMDELQDVENQDFLQTDAAINPGNSGGPLVNMKGEVIGINNSIASNGGGNEGVGFSIPINLARWIMTQLVSNGRVSRGALGIDLHPEFRTEEALERGLDRPKGAWIDTVHAQSPAAAAGLRDGDVILRFKGVEVHDLNHLINLVSMAPIGEAAELVVWRDRKLLAMSVRVGDRERTIAAAAPVAETAAPKGLLRRPERPAVPASTVLGLELATLNEADVKRLGLPVTEHGAMLMKVDTTSPFATLFQPNDVIISVDGKPVRSAEEATKLLGRSTDHAPLVLEFDRLVNGAIERREVKVP